MFCPSCGSEERQASQYCRACGTDLRPVRVSLERPDSITASAVSAREEIGRAVAQKIREVEDARDLKRVAEDVLPQIEKFLESYEEKRLRRVRAGVVVAASGFGTGILGLIMSAVLRGPDAESESARCWVRTAAIEISNHFESSSSASFIDHRAHNSSPEVRALNKFYGRNSGRRLPRF